jgi:hypothetical protein
MLEHSDASDALRRTLVQQGYRLVSFSFDGCGDEGNVEKVCVAPAEYANTALHDCTLDISEFECKVGVYNNELGKYEYKASPYYTQFKTLLKTFTFQNEKMDGGSLLYDIAHHVLEEHFPGDWVNNDGGYGWVGIDLLTGDFRIDGWARYTDSEEADAMGTALTALSGDISAPEFDLTAAIKNTLT